MNATGHMILFQMAYNNMTPQVQKRVADLVADPNNPQENNYQTNKLDDDIPTAATYPDVYKADARTHGWDDKGQDHFYNQAIGDPNYTHGKTPGTPNGITQLAAEKAILANSHASRDDLANALRWTIHLYGDIGAQPAHVVDYYNAQFPNGDGGGNKFALSWGGDPKHDASLHALMDSGGAHADSSGRAENNFKFLGSPIDAGGRAFIEQRAKALQQQFPREKYVTQVSDQDPQHWAKDLAAQAQQVWSEFKPGEAMSPNDRRLAGIEQTMNQNVAIAAYRLADLCNKAFGTADAVAQSVAGVPPHPPVVAH